MESAAAGLAAGINAAEAAKRRQPLIFPEQTALGSLLRYISIPGGAFQPMNVNFGLFPPIKIEKNQRKQKNLLLAQRALQELQGFIEKNRQAFE
ncbi:Methylenetetrahydrofolate--tRNA-(uracil-5-)-methyltransferase TrmFO [bioreactor metagenome]|uniref:Methylenetetrahydrofolate--tRNA-(Uracil-5-)-methyltransferase TrmFO n=1 Tax=bioreactor metagenome TaxID=1076179 RepID=A0A645H343_9ZZZZ